LAARRAALPVMAQMRSANRVEQCPSSGLSGRHMLAASFSQF
jgi:hypothetical protein